MYTEEFDNNQDMGNISINSNYDDSKENDTNPTFWNSNKSLIIKIIIVAVCLLVLIWLIIKLNSNDTTIDSTVYNNNVTNIRLASEKYYFIDNDMTDSDKNVALSTIGINSVTDYNNKVCDNRNSYVSLTKGQDAYILKINLICPQENNVKVFYYDLKTFACLNCQGILTYMDGSNKKNDESNEIVNEYSCTEWSAWTSEKIDDNSLEVRTRTLVKGSKPGEQKETITYGEWSEYTETPITASNSLEVETIVQEKWVSKVSDVEISETSTIRNINKITTNSGSYSTCPSGYKKTSDGSKCFKDGTSDLTYLEAFKYGVIPCDGVYYKDNVQMFKNCQVTIYKNLEYKSSSVTTYTYEEAVNVTYYRSRTKSVQVTYGEPILTDYVLESELLQGYNKINGSEKLEYSYKLSSCEK